MCDEQIAEPQPLLQIAQQVHDLRLDRHIERRNRLVADDEIGLHAQGPGNTDPLSLTARHLVRVARRDIGGQAHQVEQLCNPLPRRNPAAADAMHQQRLGQCIADAVPRIERRERILVDHLHLAAQLL